MKTLWRIGALALMLGSSLSTQEMALPVSAQGLGKCPECHLPNVKGQAVTMKYGGKSTVFRCVYCALDEAQGDDFQGDLQIFAPTEKAGRNVVIRRTKGQWSASRGAAFVAAQRMNHRLCPQTYHAFSTRAAAQQYIAKNKAKLGNAKPLNLAQMLKVADD